MRFIHSLTNNTFMLARDKKKERGREITLLISFFCEHFFYPIYRVQKKIEKRGRERERILLTGVLSIVFDN